MKEGFFSCKKWLMRFLYALQGISSFYKTEHNAILFSLVTIALIVLSFVVKLSSTELMLLILVTGLVWICELINTAIEKLADVVSPGYNKAIKTVKDIAAAAVLLATIVAFVIGLILFIPKIF